MADDMPVEEKRESIGKAIDNLKGVVTPSLCRIKVGLERSYLNLLRKGIAAFDHSYQKYGKGR